MNYEEQLRQEIPALESRVTKPKRGMTGWHFLLILVLIFCAISSVTWVLSRKVFRTVNPGTYHVVTFKSGEKRVVDQPNYFAIIPQKITVWPLRDHVLFESEIRLKDGVPILVSADVYVITPIHTDRRLELEITYQSYIDFLNDLEGLFRLATRRTGTKFTASSLYFGSEYWVDGGGFNVLVRNDFNQLLQKKLFEDGVSYLSMVGTWSFTFDFPEDLIQKFHEKETLQEGEKHVYWNGKK